MPVEPTRAHRVAGHHRSCPAGPRSAPGARTSSALRAGARSRPGCRSRPRPSPRTRRDRDRRRRPSCRPAPGSPRRCGTGCRAGRTRRRCASAPGRSARSASAGSAGQARAGSPAPATPSAARPAHAWKRRTAAWAWEPKPPSIDPDGKPCQARENWSAATSQPEAPGPIVRLPSDGLPRRPSAARVAAPATPSATSPLRAWKRLTAARVPGPATPSTVPP